WHRPIVAAGRTRGRPVACRSRIRRRSGAVSGLGPALCFAGAFVAGLLIAAPLQLVVADAPLPGGLSASRVEGSPWRGRLHHVEWQGVALGEVRAALLPLPLLAGHKVLRLETGEATLSLHGGRVRGVSRVDGLVPLP